MVPERTSSGFGGRLRDARERRGVSLRQIANATKISVGVLEALERNDISKLPGGIFGRAFVRSYAIEVGLDPEATIQDFIANFPKDSVIAGHPTSDRIEDRVAFEGDRRTAGTFLRMIAISVPIVVGLLYFATVGRQVPSEPATPPAAAVEKPAAQEPPQTPSSAPVPESPAAASVDGALRPAPAAAVPTVPAAATASSTAAAADVRPAATSGDQLTVVMTVTRPCWVSATVDGQRSIQRLLQAGERQTVTVRREMVLTAGDAAAIALQFNGADARALGKAGQVVTARFNLANYKDYLQAP
jgi:cytoskeletal protein RodZ